MVIRKIPLCIGICLLALVTANFLIGLLKGFSNGSRAYMNYDSFYFVGCSLLLVMGVSLAKYSISRNGRLGRAGEFFFKFYLRSMRRFRTNKAFKSDS